jgi:hypothetical protein
MGRASTQAFLRARRARRKRSRRGAVMLVVMLVLMVATASAVISVNTVQSELQAAGNDRIALQTRYVAEAAIMTTVSWIDMLGDTGQWLETWNDWTTPPEMWPVGEPELPTNRQATRTSMWQQRALTTNTNEVPPLADATPYGTGGGGAGGSGGSGGTGGSGGSGGSGGAGGAGGGPAVDFLGSFGPRQSYVLPSEGYVVDITDCQIAPTAGTPGSPVGGGPGSLRVVQFYCVLTAHGRLVQSSGLTRTWTFNSHNYAQSMFGSSHDSRATIVTPAMIVPAE